MRTAGFLTGAAVVVVVIVAVMTVQSVEMVDKGYLLPYADEVRRLRVFGRFEFYTALESRITLSMLNTALLASSAAVSFLAGTLLRRRTGGSERAGRFFRLAGAGTCT